MKKIRAYPEEDKIDIKLVEPNNHCVNVSERVIQTFNNHSISGLSIGDKNFPRILWSYLIGQAQEYLNILWTL